MKKIFTIIFLCLLTGLLLTSCVKDAYVVLDKECIHHTFSSDNYYLILQRSDGKKVTYSVTEKYYIHCNIGDTLEQYR